MAQIDITKTYKTRGGSRVTNLNERAGAAYPIRGFAKGIERTWTSAGHYISGETNALDLIPVEAVKTRRVTSKAPAGLNTTPAVPAAPQPTFDTGTAIALLKGGQKVARAGWNGKGMFLFLVPGSTFQVNRAPLLGIYPEGTEVNYQPHVDMKTAEGTVVPWLASQSDLLATDWVLVA